jgi:hypothetical protein
MEVAREPLYFLFKFKASITRLIGKIHREDFSYSVQPKYSELIPTLLPPFSPQT